MAEVRVRPIYTGNDGAIDKEEWQDWRKSDGKGLSNDAIVQIIGSDGRIYSVKLSELESQFGNGKANPFQPSADNLAPEVKEAERKAKTLETQMQTAINEIEDMKKNGVAPDKIEERQKQLREMVKQANALFEKAGKRVFDLTPYNKAVGADDAPTGKAMTISTEQKSPNAPGAGGQGAAAQTAGAPMTSAYPPAGWGAQYAGPQFNTSAYLQSIAMGDNIMSSWDGINQNVNRGKQLMMLFFYFAKMAESGDMGAMYQFMKFITYIISKDKAKQQIEMGKKLIQLQDLSRQWTNKLLALQTNASDPNTTNELTKTMTIVKSETDAIATSQKLISQMMEEFAQVVESLTNTTKSALETHGRILRTVSAVRG